jgi:hypothetical protein
MSAGAFVVVATVVCAAPARAQTQALVIGKHTSSAAFPCAPQRQQQLLAKTEAGDIVMTSLMCSQGDSVYMLAVTAYPPALIKALSVDEALDSTLDDARSKSFMNIKSSQRETHQNLPAVRNHLLDSRKPPTESVITAVLASPNMIVIQVTAPLSGAQSKTSTDFLASLKIASTKK